MKITVRVSDIEICVEEYDSSNGDRTVTMRYADQNKQIQETIKVITQCCIDLCKLRDGK